MRQNLGTMDRGIRVFVAIAISILFFSETISGTIGIVLMIFAGVMLLTSLMGYCPLYSLLGISTYKNKNQNPYQQKLDN